MTEDPAQLPPSCMSANMRYKSADSTNTSRRVNPLSEQFRLSPLERFRDIGWPYWLIPEQCRIEPGGFDLPNHLFYSNLSKYQQNNVLTTGPILFEQWFMEFSKEQQSIQRRQHHNASQTEVRDSPQTIREIQQQREIRGHIERRTLREKVYTGIFPVIIAISNAYTFPELRGTSKGRSHFVHFGLLSIRSFAEKTKISPSGIGVLCPYLR